MCAAKLPLCRQKLNPLRVYYYVDKKTKDFWSINHFDINQNSARSHVSSGILLTITLKMKTNDLLIGEFMTFSLDSWIKMFITDFSSTIYDL